MFSTPQKRKRHNLTKSVTIDTVTFCDAVLRFRKPLPSIPPASNIVFEEMEPLLKEFNRDICLPYAHSTQIFSEWITKNSFEISHLSSLTRCLFYLPRGIFIVHSFTVILVCISWKMNGSYVELNEVTTEVYICI